MQMAKRTRNVFDHESRSRASTQERAPKPKTSERYTERAFLFASGTKLAHQFQRRKPASGFAQAQARGSPHMARSENKMREGGGEALMQIGQSFGDTSSL